MTHNKFSFYTNLSIQETLEALHTSYDGLTSIQAEQRLQQRGPNALAQKNSTWIDLLKNQLVSPFMCILIFIACAYLFTKSFTESFIISIIIAINVAIGFYQEYHSNKSLQVLKKYLISRVKVKRNNQESTIVIEQLVPGDIIYLSAGDIIPADCRFIADEHLSIDESSMTGESILVEKTSQAAEKSVTHIADAKNIGFAGTVIAQGKATAVVIATGTETELGTIAVLTGEIHKKWGLEKGTTQLARLILYFIFFSLIGTVIITVLCKQGTINFGELILFSAALAVTAAPEALPMVTTFCLARAASKLKKHNIIVKRLSALGDLGSIEIFCTDKTGTLTENTLCVESLHASNTDQALIWAALASPALTKSKEKRQKGFENALYNALTESQKEEIKQYAVIQESPFTPQKRRCSALIEKDGIYTLITKGSPEHIIDLCSLSLENKADVVRWVEKKEQQGERVLALATKKIAASVTTVCIEKNDHGYELLECISFYDPLKESSRQMIQKAKQLGVQVKIMSGDSKNVCFAVAKQLGIVETVDDVVLGSEFEQSSPEQKAILAHNNSVFARVTPEQKYDIIHHLQKKYSVGYIGDGINDAPALKLAHVSFAVNDSAPVAQEAAEIILLQNNLLSIIHAIEEGRKVIANIVKYITITTAPSFGHFYSLSIAPLLISSPSMLPLQLLFINLITDLPMIALSTDVVGYEEIQQPLRYDIGDIAIIVALFGAIITLCDLILFSLFASHLPTTVQTSWFIVTTISEIIFIFLLRTKYFFTKAKMPSYTLMILSVCAVTVALIMPYTRVGQEIFMFSPVQPEHFPWLLLVICFNCIIAECIKLIYYRTKLC